MFAVSIFIDSTKVNVYVDVVIFWKVGWYLLIESNEMSWSAYYSFEYCLRLFILLAPGVTVIIIYIYYTIILVYYCIFVLQIFYSLKMCIISFVFLFFSVLPDEDNL